MKLPFVSSRTEFILNRAEDIKRAVNLLNNIRNYRKQGKISEELMQDVINDSRFVNYELDILDFIDTATVPENYPTHADDVIDNCISIEERSGTEKQMLLFAVQEFASILETKTELDFE